MPRSECSPALLSRQGRNCLPKYEKLALIERQLLLRRIRYNGHAQRETLINITGLLAVVAWGMGVDYMVRLSLSLALKAYGPKAFANLASGLIPDMHSFGRICLSGAKFFAANFC